MKINLRLPFLICLIATMLAGMTAFAQAQDNAAPSSTATLYKAAKVYTMEGEPLSPGQVLVQDGKIKAIGETIATPENGVEVDLGEASIIPGLVNAYSQLPLAEGSTAEITEEVTPEFKAAAALDWDKPAMKRLMLGGTTTIQACPATQNVISGITAVLKTDPEQRQIVNDNGALVAAVCNDPASGNRSRSRPDTIFVRQPTNRMGVVWILRNTFNQAKENPDGTLAKVNEALSGKRPLMMVSRMSYDLNTVGTLADEFDFSPVIVGGQEAYKIKSIMAERNYPIVLQPLATGSVSGPEGSDVCWNQAGVLIESGLTVALSGDDLLEQARFAHRFGLTEQQALKAVTLTPAKLLGLEKHVGSLAAGKDADMLVLSGDPLELSTSIRWVIINGKATQVTKDQ